MIEGIREAGVSPLGIAEPVGQPCDECGERPGGPHRCPSDGAHHRHGMVHVLRGRLDVTRDSPDARSHKLLWLCARCYADELDVHEYRFGGR